MRRRALAAALLLLLACATPPPPPATPAAAEPPSAGVATLLALGDDALAEGEPALALDRFERALAAAPASPEARIGAGRALAALGRVEPARAALEAGLAVRPDSAPALVALADLAIARGDRADAAALLERAFLADPARIDAHQKLADLTGPAPPGARGDPVARADAHPYDAAARLAAGEALLAAGSPGAAREHLESALVLSDLDPAAARRSAALLAQHFDDWRARRVVWVHAYSDEILRADPAWRFQQRIAWLVLSQSLDPVLHTRFLLADLGTFRSEAAGFDLPPIEAAARVQIGALPREGIVAFLTGRPAPRRPGAWKLGQAEFLGRVVTVRVAPREVASRVLAHEVVHLYGGVHVNPDVESLMNPSGHATRLDPQNVAILHALASRRFGPGGLEANVIEAVPLHPAIEAYAGALQLNLALRNAGVREALAASEGSVRAAAPQLRQAIALDDHLGDVASFVGELLLRDGRRPGAARLFAIASSLYGAGDPRARRALERARALATAHAG